MSKSALVWTILIALGVAGCSQKNTFQPDTLDGRLGYSDRTPEPMIASHLYLGATLKDGSLLAPGHETLSLPKGYLLVGINGPWRVAAHPDGTLLALNTQNGHRHKHSLPSAPLAATTDGQIIATTTRDNSHRILDLGSGETLFLTRERASVAIGAQVAPPLIDAKGVIFGTLDGKLLVVDRNSFQMVLERVISSESFFNNVIALHKYHDQLIAATASRLISVQPDGTVSTLDTPVRQLSLLPSGLYLLGSEGAIIRLDANLRPLYRTRIPFARLIGAHERGGDLYLIERSGYLIKTTPKLSKLKLYELPDTLSAPVLITPSHLYHHQKGVVWP